MESNLTLNTERLLLEPLSLKHATERYASWLNDPEVYKYLETRGGQTTESLKEFITKQIDGNVYIWAIIDKTLNVHIGNIKIDPIHYSHKYGEYGILIGDKNYWGKGSAREASVAVLNYFFDKKDYLRKINLGVLKKNVEAINLYNKLGFKQEGLLHKHLLYNGKEEDVLRMALFREDFLSHV
jgi:ribosomal-protein-alanine N-acetyltransferase